MQYGITYVPGGGVFGQSLCADMVSYGYARLFDSYAEAAAHLAGNVPLKMMDGEVVAARHAEQAVREIVEVFTGRRKVDGTKRPVVNPDRPTLERVRELLTPRKPLSNFPRLSTGNPIERIRKQRT